jgi:lysophospholipase L1-like esterase
MRRAGWLNDRGVLVLSLGLTLTSCGKSRDVGAVGGPAASPSANSARAATSGHGEASSATGQPVEAALPEPSPSESHTKSGKRRRYRVLALGDSITDQRVGGGGYLRELGRACPLSRFDHFGRGGDMVNQMRRRFEQALPQTLANYDTLIVYGGVNDLYSDLTAGRTNDLIETDLSAIYAAAKDRGLSVVAITVSPWGGFSRYHNERRSRSTRLLNAWIQGTSRDGQTDVVVDSYALLSCGDSERLCPEYESPSHDGLHPGPQGHALLGQALLERAFSDCE